MTQFAGYKVFTGRPEAEAFLETPVTPETIAAESDAKKTADAAYAAERESFQRCDTDGFVSQWCHTLNGRENDMKSKVERTGGASIFRGVIDIETGELVATKVYEFFNKFAGYGYVTKFRVVRNGKVEWISDVYQRTSSYTKKGLKEVWVVAPAYVKTSHTGYFSTVREIPRGFSGLGEVSAMTFLDYGRAGLKV